MSDLDYPPFLEDTFLFDADGYRYSSPPPLDLLSPEALQSSEPWVVLAAASLALAVTTLVGDAGSQKDVEGLIRLMGEDQYSYTRVVACEAAAQSGYLWMAEKILGSGRPLEIQAALEEFVASGAVKTIPVGKRWFHGHAVPDA